MDMATKNISKAMYDAYLIASDARLATVFRIDCNTGEQFFFATSTERELIGHLDASARLPHSKRAAIRHLTAIASVAAFDGLPRTND